MIKSGNIFSEFMLIRITFSKFIEGGCPKADHGWVGLGQTPCLVGMVGSEPGRSQSSGRNLQPKSAHQYQTIT